MAYSGDLIQFYYNNAWTTLPKIKKYAPGYKKLWSDDTGRSITGENKGTLVGIFPKLTLTFAPMTEDEMSIVENITCQASCLVKYYDSHTKTLLQNSFYFGDVDTDLMRKDTMMFEECTITVVANKKRS